MSLCDDRSSSPGSVTDLTVAHVALRSAQQEFAAGPDRPHLVNQWLAGVLQSWGLQPALSHRWLDAGRDVLKESDVLVAYVQHDPALQLFTLELWWHGSTVYGIDDWLG